MSIEIRAVSKHFGDSAVLRRIDLTIEDGELIALLGPSGSGKTTLLRILAGLEVPDPDGGRLVFDGIDVTTARPSERRIGIVFQHYALFKHLSVLDNIGFGLKIRRGRARVPTEARRAKARELLARVQLDGLGDRYPGQLSGGQQQRVGLARALSIEPRVLLLDEPFGALDAQVRKDLRRWLRGLHRELGLTSVFVTHDQEEALEIADRVAVLRAGRIEQIGTPTEVYESPASAFVCEFLGTSNVIAGHADGESVHIDGVPFPAAHPPGDVRVYVRPHDIELLARANGTAAVPVTIDEIHEIGPLVRVLLKRTASGGRLEAHLTHRQLAELALRPGDRAFARPGNLKAFRAEGA